jgi:hypothetical protein
MSAYELVRGSAVSIRWAAWRAGGMILLVMGAASAAVAIGGLIFAGGGVIFLPLALPPLGAGYMVLRAIPGARIVGVLVAALYGAFIWSVVPIRWAVSHRHLARPTRVTSTLRRPWLRASS